MLAVPLSEQEVQPFLSESLSLAAINGPSLCVISGTIEAIAKAEQELNASGIVCRAVHTSHAYHSQMMEPVLSSFAAEVARVELHAPQIPYISSLTGTWIKIEEATDAGYWSRQLREPVRFSAAIAQLVKEPGRMLLEVGPGQTLSALARLQRNGSERQLVWSSLPHVGEEKSESEHFLGTLGQLWAAGTEVDWAAFYSREERRRVPLPTYPFERERYWIEAQPTARRDGSSSDLLSRKSNAADWLYVPSWKRSILRRKTMQPDALLKKPCCLVFADNCGLGPLIAEQLETGGEEVFLVKAAEEFRQVSERTFEIDPGRRQDYDALLDKVRARGRTLQTILHGWGVSETGDGPVTPDSFAACQTKIFQSVLYLAQALGESILTDPLQLVVVTNNLQEVTGEESLSPEKATVLGLCKVIPQEYPQISCRAVDVVLPARKPEQEALANHLIAELAAPEGDPLGRLSWTPSVGQVFEPIKIAKPLPDLSGSGVCVTAECMC
jgi:acyl transferase domain-containing protein